MIPRIFSYPDVLIIIFAREPIIGQVKTRLIPALGQEGATELYKRLLRYTVNNVVQSELAPVNLCITPESCKLFFTRMENFSALELSQQRGHDLGSRMYNALVTALHNYSKALLIGTDCPFLTQDVLQQAIMALDCNDMVFSPARDGGYVLVGAKKTHANIFANIDWGTERVMEQSRNALLEYGIKWRELSEQCDIDVKDDLKYLYQHNEFKEYINLK